MKISKLVLNLSLAVMAGVVSMQASAAAPKKSPPNVAGGNSTAFVCKNNFGGGRDADTNPAKEESGSQTKGGTAAKKGKT